MAEPYGGTIRLHAVGSVDRPDVSHTVGEDVARARAVCQLGGDLGCSIEALTLDDPVTGQDLLGFCVGPVGHDGDTALQLDSPAEHRSGQRLGVDELPGPHELGGERLHERMHRRELLGGQRQAVGCLPGQEVVVPLRAVHQDHVLHAISPCCSAPLRRCSLESSEPSAVAGHPLASICEMLLDSEPGGDGTVRHGAGRRGSGVRSGLWTLNQCDPGPLRAGSRGYRLPWPAGWSAARGRSGRLTRARPRGASSSVSTAAVEQVRFELAAERPGVGTASPKSAIARWIRRRRDLAVSTIRVRLRSTCGSASGTADSRRGCTGTPACRRPRPRCDLDDLPRYMTATRSLMWRTTDRLSATNR